MAVSLGLTAGISAVGAALVGGFPDPLLHEITFVVTFVVLALLFGAMFKILPDAVVAWRDVRVGAIVTALLFVAGKFELGLYLGRSNPGEAVGAAGALALMLGWIYYSSMIVFFGAEFTQQYAHKYGQHITPKPHAVFVEERELADRPQDREGTGRPRAEGRFEG